MRVIFPADDPDVLSGKYDREGFTPKERRAQMRAARRQPLGLDTPRVENVAVVAPPDLKGPTMRLFDDDKIGCYLDHIDHRVEKTTDGREVKMVDLTLRVQPFTPELAVSLDPDVRALLFSLSDGTPKPKLKAAHFNMTVPNQQLAIAVLPELAEGLVLCDCEVGALRARTEKGVDGFALVFYVAYGPASPRELEYVCDWLTQQRFITFHPQQPALDLVVADDAPPRRRRRSTPIEAGDELHPGREAEF